VCRFFEARARHSALLPYCLIARLPYRVPGTRHLGAGPTPRTEHRAPKTEPGRWKTRTSGLHPAVDDVLADMATVGWLQAWIGGASFGAALALVCLSRAPERFKGAFLYGTPWDRPGPWLRRVIRWMDQWRAWDRLGRVFRWWAFLTLAPEVLRLPRSLRDSYRQWFFERWPRYSVPMAVLGRRIALLSSLADHVRLDRIDLPVWVLAGARDRLVRPRYQQALARRLPRAVFVCIPGVGHLAPQTHPSVLAGWITRLLTL
jgi:pimeloyl-ACP methyl ester carboxylesterase